VHSEHTDAGGRRPQVGDADLSVIGSALADKGRCKIFTGEMGRAARTLGPLAELEDLSTWPLLRVR
jgi:hypothetical protein